jgi:ABC-type glycerol-3-phosphate transport system substrate-binding protein
MGTRFWMKSLAVAVFAFATLATGCGGGSGGGGADHATRAVSQDTLAHADAVNVTYYYLPG